MHTQRGQSLFEVTVVLAIMAVVAVVGNSAIDAVQRGVALRGATGEVRAALVYTRTLAVARDRNIGLRFRPDGEAWTWAVYEDGDGDGVRNDDIQKRVDRELQPPRRFQHAVAGIGLPDVSLPDPMNGGRLEDRLAVRFGSSMICSFTRQGEVTNGSVVVTDGATAVILQAHGRSGRISVHRWDGRKWRSGV